MFLLEIKLHRIRGRVKALIHTREGEGWLHQLTFVSLDRKINKVG